MVMLMLLIIFALFPLTGFCQNNLTLPIGQKLLPYDLKNAVIWIVVEKKKPKGYLELMDEVCQKVGMGCKIELVNLSHK